MPARYEIRLVFTDNIFSKMVFILSAIAEDVNLKMTLRSHIRLQVLISLQSLLLLGIKVVMA